LFLKEVILVKPRRAVCSARSRVVMCTVVVTPPFIINGSIYARSSPLCCQSSCSLPQRDRCRMRYVRWAERTSLVWLWCWVAVYCFDHILGLL
jgi:hypothetical protein